MGFFMTGGIMTAAAAYLWKRRRKTEGGKTAVLLFALVFLYPILAGGSLEKIWLGYLATLLLSAPIPSRMFVNYAHRKMKPHGGLPAVSGKLNPPPKCGNEAANASWSAA